MIKHGVERGSGREKMFEVREIESDQSFIRNYLTKELTRREDLYLFQKQGQKYKITDKDHEAVRDQLVTMRVNGGFPYITVQDGDYVKAGELYLKHHFEDVELDVGYLEKTLPYVYQLWGRNVHIETKVEGRDVVFSFGGKKVQKKYL
jgi:stage V sporulation protein R